MLRQLLLGLVALPSLTSSLAAQCGDWNGPFNWGGIQGSVTALATFDDGSGLKLYVGGYFQAAFGVPASHLACFDGTNWAEVGGGVDGLVSALTVFDDGSGPALYVGGSFAHAGGVVAHDLARWDGATWANIGDTDAGVLSDVRAFAACNENGVERLFATGSFGAIDGVACSGIARFDGASWSPVGGGLTVNGSYPGTGFTLGAFDDGSGAALYCGGNFDQAGSAPNSQRLARWDGATWSAVGGGITGSVVFSLATYDDGNGAQLHVGGFVLGAGGTSYGAIMRWNGGAWSALTGGLLGGSPTVRAMHVFDDGAGPELYCGGSFLYAYNGGPTGIDTPHLARWNGTSWSGIDPTFYSSVSDSVEALASYGGELCVGGTFSFVGGVLTRNFALFSNGEWRNAGHERALSGPVNALLAVEDAALGRGLYAGGAFEHSGSGSLNGIARWDGVDWHPLGDGLDNSVTALGLFDEGSGLALYAGGYFDGSGSISANHIARWDGVNWSELGSGIDGAVNALATFDDGSGEALYVAGAFTLAGGVSVSNLARWDGVNWSAVGAPLTYSGSSGAAHLRALAVFDDGTGAGLYVAGHFTAAGTSSARYVARWDGAQWSQLGSPQVTNDVRALAVYDDGSGPALYAGGPFAKAGGVVVKGIARWDGVNWSKLGTYGVPSSDGVERLAVHTDGAGSVLVAAGFFEEIDQVPAYHIARWNGASWSPYGSGLTTNGVSSVYALASFDDGSHPWPQLFAGGWFTIAGGSESNYIARWSDPCACQATSYCTAGTTSHGCVPAISGAGAPSASASSGFTIRVANVEGQKVGHIFYGLSGAIANPWSPTSSSYLCVKAPSQRTPTQNSGGTDGACDGALAIDWNAFVTANPGCLGSPFTPGTDVWAQLYFRDPPAPKTTNLSDGLKFTVCP